MAQLTDEEQARVLELIRAGKPLPLEWFEKLFAPAHDGEFLWAGKHASLGSQEAMKPLPGLPEEKDPSASRLFFHGDNLLAMRYLLTPQGHSLMQPETGIKLIYIDPPFAVGTDFHVEASQIAKAACSFKSAKQDPAKADTQSFFVASGNEAKNKKAGHARAETSKGDHIFAYSDTWANMGEYYSMLYPRLVAMHMLLAHDGCLCVHCDWRTSPAIRLMLDEIFGTKNFINEIIWHYTGGGRSHRYFSRKHDSLLLYAKGNTWTFNTEAIRVPYKESSGYAKAGIVSKAGKRYLPNTRGSLADDVWDIPIINPMSKERIGYATQKPLRLLERLVATLTNPNDLVADFFCGSSSTLVAAENLHRRWIGCDKGELAKALTLQRLQNNLGLQEKQAIHTAHFSLSFF